MSRTSNRLGPLLDAAIKASSYSQVTLADTLGTHQPMISRYVRGKQAPSPGWLNTVSAALNLTEEQRKELHRAAAVDAGFEIDLT